MSRDWTPADVTGIIGNPVYAINIAPVLAEPHPLLISEEQWVATNARLITDLEPETYLRRYNDAGTGASTEAQHDRQHKDHAAQSARAGCLQCEPSRHPFPF